MAFAALLGALPRVAWVMFVTTIIWVTIYDTLYAMVDREDDLKIGVNSSAIVFADMDRLIVGALQLTMLLALLLMGRSLDFGNAYLGAVGVAALFFPLSAVVDPCARAQRLPARLLNNHYVGMSIFIGILLEYIYRP